MTYTNNKNVGTASVTIKGKNGYTGTVVKKFTIVKGTQKMSVSPASKTFKKTSLAKAKKNTTFTLKVSNSNGALTFKSSNKKYITVNSKKVVTVKKNTPKGTYTITVTAAGNSNYTSCSKVCTIKVQ